MDRRRLTHVCLLTLAVSGSFQWNPIRASAEELTKVILSPPYHVTQKYRSMMGPQSTSQFELGDRAAKEMVWITGYKAEMVGKDGRTPMAQEFMCHSNLDLDPLKRTKLFDAQGGISGRLFTLSQGQLDIRFPKGFGIPIGSDEDISLTTQVLNLNHDEPDLHVRHQVTVRYTKDGKGMKPLFQKGIYGMKLLEGKDGFYGMPEGHAEGTGCLEGENASGHSYEDGKGRKFTGHWVVKPGREVNHTPVSRVLDLPYDTKVHYIAVHLHPFARSIALVDLTDKKTVFRSEAKNYDDKIGLSHVDYLSSPEGVTLYRDHQYELVSVYENTTDEDQDSMAVMYLYLHDQSFERN